MDPWNFVASSRIAADALLVRERASRSSETLATRNAPASTVTADERAEYDTFSAGYVVGSMNWYSSPFAAASGAAAIAAVNAAVAAFTLLISVSPFWFVSSWVSVVCVEGLEDSEGSEEAKGTDETEGSTATTSATSRSNADPGPARSTICARPSPHTYSSRWRSSRCSAASDRVSRRWWERDWTSAR